MPRRCGPAIAGPIHRAAPGHRPPAAFRPQGAPRSDKIILPALQLTALHRLPQKRFPCFGTGGAAPLSAICFCPAKNPRPRAQASHPGAAAFRRRQCAAPGPKETAEDPFRQGLSAAVPTAQKKEAQAPSFRNAPRGGWNIRRTDGPPSAPDLRFLPLRLSRERAHRSGGRSLRRFQRRSHKRSCRDAGRLPQHIFRSLGAARASKPTLDPRQGNEKLAHAAAARPCTWARHADAHRR